jgi:hypothetical protein
MGVTVFIEDVSSLENKYRGVFPPHLHYFLIFLGEFRHDESMCRRGLGGMFNFVRASFKLKCYERNLSLRELRLRARVCEVRTSAEQPLIK